MPTYNMHIRRYDTATTPNLWAPDPEITLNGYANRTIFSSFINDMNQFTGLFSVVPVITSGTVGSPTNTNFGPTTYQTFSQLKNRWYPLLGYYGVDAVGHAYIQSDNSGLDGNHKVAKIATSNWSSSGWTIGTYATFKSEICNYIANCVYNESLLTPGSRDELCNVLDWDVIICTNQYDGNQNLVFFYPGNDPSAHETIQVII